MAAWGFGALPARGAAPGQNLEVYRDLVPLTDLTNTYKEEDGGLYGGGRNEMPEAFQAAYAKESERIEGLDPEGKSSPTGKIGLVILGFSNTLLEGADFKTTADADLEKSGRVVIVNGAQGGRAAVMWAYDGAACLAAAEQDRLSQEMDLLGMPKENRRGSKDTWPTLDARLREAGVGSNQVQVAWMKHVDARPAPLGEFPKHARALQADIADVVLIAKHRFPNLRVVFLSSRTFGGWGSPSSGSPEPYAYETAFAVRWLIQSQMRGEPELNFDPARGQVRAPLLRWGPYLWARGDTPRLVDGFTWTQADVRSNDHLHPSAAGCRKTTDLLLTMFKTDPATRRWFLRSPDEPPAVESVKPLAAPAPGRAEQSTLAATNSLPRLEFAHARRLVQKRQLGESLTTEEAAYLARARQALRKQRAGEPLTDEEKAFLDEADRVRNGGASGRSGGKPREADGSR